MIVSAVSLLKKYIAFMQIDEKDFMTWLLKEKPQFISRRH